MSAGLSLAVTLPRTDAWQDRALCATVDSESFFPEKGGTGKDAKRVCQACPVRPECLEYAIENDERHGIWGGLSVGERDRVAAGEIPPPPRPEPARPHLVIAAKNAGITEADRRIQAAERARDTVSTVVGDLKAAAAPDAPGRERGDDKPPLPAAGRTEAPKRDGRTPPPPAPGGAAENLGIHLRAKIRALGWTPADLSEKSGLSAHITGRALNGNGADLAVAEQLAGLVGGYLATMIGPYACTTCQGEPPEGYSCMECAASTPRRLP